MSKDIIQRFSLLQISTLVVLAFPRNPWFMHKNRPRCNLVPHYVSFSTDRTMEVGGVPPEALLWFNLLGLVSLGSALNPDDPNVCSHWERSAPPTFLRFRLLSGRLWSEIKPLSMLQWTNGLAATNQDGAFANNQKLKGRGFVPATYWGHKFRAVVMRPPEWSHHSVPR